MEKPAINDEIANKKTSEIYQQEMRC